MENIHTILEKYGITVDEERKADFEKSLRKIIKPSLNTVKWYRRVTGIRRSSKPHKMR